MDQTRGKAGTGNGAAPVHIAVIETGRAPRSIRGDYPSYPEMFERLMGDGGGRAIWHPVAVPDGAPPSDALEADAILVTGSAAGVYDDLPWMAPLMDTIREAAADRIPLAGVCFGHQAIAHALGGRAEKSAKGWGVGRHSYEVTAHHGWMGPAAEQPATVAMAVSHQDQVTALPEGASVFLASEFCPLAGIAYGPAANAVSVQGHPEFGNAFSAALYRARSETLGARAEEASASLSQPEDNHRIGQWLMRVLLEGAA